MSDSIDFFFPDSDPIHPDGTTLKIEGYDHCILGLATGPTGHHYLVYSRESMEDTMVALHGLTEEEASDAVDEIMQIEQGWRTPVIIQAFDVFAGQE